MIPLGCSYAVPRNILQPVTIGEFAVRDFLVKTAFVSFSYAVLANQIGLLESIAAEPYDVVSGARHDD